MNSYQRDIQDAIANLGDHLGRVQLLLRNLAESRALSEIELDPETELELVCYLEEADELLGRHRRRRFTRSA